MGMDDVKFFSRGIPDYSATPVLKFPLTRACSSALNMDGCRAHLVKSPAQKRHFYLVSSLSLCEAYGREKGLLGEVYYPPRLAYPANASKALSPAKTVNSSPQCRHPVSAGTLRTDSPP